MHRIRRVDIAMMFAWEVMEWFGRFCSANSCLMSPTQEVVAKVALMTRPLTAETPAAAT